MINSVYGYPPDDSAASALHELGRLNVENTRLRQELFDAAEKYSDLNDCRKMTEIEFKHMMKKEAEKSEKELSIRARDISSLRRDHANEIANLKKQLSSQQQQFQQQQKNQQRLNSEKSSVNSKYDSTGRNSSEDLATSNSSQMMGIPNPPSIPQSQSQSLSSDSNQSISLQSNHSTYNSNTNSNINKSTSFNSTNNNVLVEKEAPSVRMSLSSTSVENSSNNHINQTSTSNVCADNNPAPVVSTSSASLSLLSSAAAVAVHNTQVTSLPANQSTGAVDGSMIGSKSANIASTVNNVNHVGDLTVINILLPLYKDLLMSTALVSTRESYPFYPTTSSRLYSSLKGDGEEACRTITESVAGVDEAFSALVRHTQPPSNPIIAAADASSSCISRTVYLICAVCSLACHVSHPTSKALEQSSEVICDLYAPAPDSRSENCNDQSRMTDAPRMDLLLKCLSLLTTAIDCLEPSDVAAVQRAQSALARESVDSMSSNSGLSSAGVLSAVGRVSGHGHESQVDLYERFERVAESPIDTNADADAVQSKRSRLDIPEGRALKKIKTIGSAVTPTEQHQDRLGSGPRAAVSKEMGSNGLRGVAPSSRSHSGVKSFVTFAEHGHTTPVGGVRSRGNSVDGDAAPPSTATTDNWSTARRLPRIRGSIDGTGDGIYRAVSLSLSALHMPGLNRTVITATCNSLSIAANLEGQDRSAPLPLPLPLGLSPHTSLPFELPCSDSQVALLPGNLVALLVDLAAISKALSFPTHAPHSYPYPYPSEGSQRSSVLSVAGTVTLPASPPPVDRRMELLSKIVDLIQTVFRGDGLEDSLCTPTDMQPLIVGGGGGGGGGTTSSSSNPLASLFAFYFPPHSPPVVLREFITNNDDESSDELQSVERETLGGRTVCLTHQQEQQLTLESSLLSTLLELLKARTTFKSFTASQSAQNSSGSRSSGRLINLLCRRLVLTVSEGNAVDFRDSGMLKGDSVESGQSFNILNIKLQVVAFLTGIVEIHGLDGVAVLFGVSEIPFPPSLSAQLEEQGGGRDRKEIKKEGRRAFPSAASSSSSRSNALREGDMQGEGEEEEVISNRISSSALHCLCLCWMLATRAVNHFPRTLPSDGLLMVQLAEAVGRLLDTMAGLMTPQQWVYLVSRGGTVDAQIISRQMSLDGLHPVLLRHCKDNPLYYL